MDDADLVVAARAGDQQAFVGIYDRYGDAIFDFCASMLRDRDRGADAAQETFVLAWERLGQLREPAKLRAWLYAIARSRALAQIRRRDRERPLEDATSIPSTHGEGEAAVNADEAAALVWAAADGLGDRDRVLLDLHLRQGLEGEELAAAVGVSTQHCHVLMSRLRDRVERSIGALLVARLGRADCEGLQALLADWDGRFSRDVRSRVTRHVESCDTCSRNRKALASPWALLGAAALPLVVAPPDLREQVVEQIRHVADIGGIDAPAFGRDGFPPPLFPRRRRRAVAILAATGVLLLLAGLGGWLAVGTDGGPERLETSAAGSAADAGRTGSEGADASSRVSSRGSSGPTSDTTDPAQEGAPTSTSSVPGGGATSGDGAGPTGSGGGSGSVSGGSPAGGGGTSGSGSAPAPAPPPPEPPVGPAELDPPLILSVLIDPDEIYEAVPVCGALPLAATVLVDVTDETGVGDVVATWDLAAWGPQGISLDPIGGDTWAASIGPYPAGTVGPGGVEDVVVTITAFDVYGNAAESQALFSVLDEGYCP